MKIDVYQQLNSYKGLLGWEQYSQAYGNETRPKTEITLFIKEQSIPIRKSKPTEISTISVQDGQNYETGTNVIFFGAPDLQQVTLSGWIVTRLQPGTKLWSIKSYDGTELNATPYNYGNRTYSEIISMYIEGQLNLSVGGAGQRKDPDYYISPYGHKYINPVIMAWDPQYSPTSAKQPFTMTLGLEV